MQVTDVRIHRLDKVGKIKAVASITIDNAFVVHDIKIIEGDRGMFIAMPSKKSSGGEYRDIAHPVNSDTREFIQRAILKNYEVALEEGMQKESEMAEARL